MGGLIVTYFVYTGTRAAWGGAAIGLALVFACLLASGKTMESIRALKARKSGFLLGIATFVVIMNTLPPYLFPGFRAQHPLTRLESMIDVETEGYSRFAIWANSLAIFADHPILGAGKGNFRFIYPVYARRVVEDPSFSAKSRAADAHNDYIQLLAETGLLGAASFLIVLGLLAVRFRRGTRRQPDARLLVLGFALVGILAEAFWDFPFNLPVPVAYFWVYAGLLWQLASTGAPETPREIPKSLIVATILFLTLAATLFSVLTLSYLRGEFYYSRGARQMLRHRLSAAEKDLAKAAGINPLNYRYHFLLGLLQISMKDYQRAADSIEHSLSLNPYNINALNNLGVAYASAGNTSKAILAFQTSLRIWLRHIEAHRNLAVLYARQGDNDRAMRHLEAVLALDPTDREARHSLEELRAPARRREQCKGPDG